MDAPPDVPAQLRATCRELAEVLDAPACVLSRVIGELLIAVAEHAPAGETLHLGHGYLLSDFPLTRVVVEERRRHCVSLADPDPDPKEAALLRELGYDSLLMLPLEADGECWGLIEVYGKGDRRFGDEDTSRAEPVLARAAVLLAG